MTPKNNTTCPQTVDQAHDYIHRQLLHEILEQNRFMLDKKNKIPIYINILIKMKINLKMKRILL